MSSEIKDVADNNEFIDNYSDDIISLREARRVLLTHPVELHWDEEINASFCRMFTIIMVGNIEAMLNKYRNKASYKNNDKDKHNIIEAYFRKKGKPIEKVKALYKAFQGIGIDVEESVFNEYLAIKYLRNIVIHSNWTPLVRVKIEESLPYEEYKQIIKAEELKEEEEQKKWIEEHGFPLSSREFTEVHWHKMQYVNEKMMLYIALTQYEGPFGKSLSSLLEVENGETENSDLGLIRKQQIPHIFWNNLEKINACLTEDFQQTEVLQTYWNEETGIDIENISHENRKKLFYLALQKAGRDGFIPLLKHKHLAGVALESWTEYWRLTYEQSFISQSDLESAKQTLLKLHKKATDTNVSKEQENTALIIGREAVNYSPNITAVVLFVIQLPIIDAEGSRIYREEGERALLAMEVANYYRKYKEGIDLSNNLVFYRDMLELDEF